MDIKVIKQASKYISCKLVSDDAECEVCRDRNKLEKCKGCDISKSESILDNFIKEYVEKETPKQPIWVRANEHVTVDDQELSCPNCKQGIRFDFITPNYRPKRCEWCGQVLDWSKDNGN